MCSICRHVQRDGIDRALTAGHDSLRDIAGRFGVGRSSVERHGRLCLRMAAPADRLHGMVARAELAAVAQSAVERALEAVDLAETRGARRDMAVALGALTRAITAAERLYPAPTEGMAADPEGQALLLAVAEVDDPGARAAITAGLTSRGADDLAAALATVWARRPAVVDAAPTREIA